MYSVAGYLVARQQFWFYPSPPRRGMDRPPLDHPVGSGRGVRDRTESSAIASSGCATAGWEEPTSRTTETLRLVTLFPGIALIGLRIGGVLVWQRLWREILNLTYVGVMTPLLITNRATTAVHAARERDARRVTRDL